MPPQSGVERHRCNISPRSGHANVIERRVPSLVIEVNSKVSLGYIGKRTGHPGVGQLVGWGG